MPSASESFVDDVALTVRGLVAQPWYPCVGAKAALNASSLETRDYGAPTKGAAARLIDDLVEFESRRGNPNDAIYASYVAAFTEWSPVDEVEFEVGLFDLLQRVHELDCDQGHLWDPTAVANPSDPHFGFSIGGRAYFIVGMHPASSRWARQLPWPALVFNSHFQFAELRRLNLFDKMKLQIRQRDISLQGSYNPEMVGSKEVSEARQYSGRRMPPDWTCPLQINPSKER